MEGLRPVHDLPLDKPRATEQAFDGAMHRFMIDGDTRQKLEQLANEGRSSLFMILQGAFSLLLSRFSNCHCTCSVFHPLFGFSLFHHYLFKLWLDSQIQRDNIISTARPIPASRSEWNLDRATIAIVPADSPCDSFYFGVWEEETHAFRGSTPRF